MEEAQILLQLLDKRGLKVATAESCTGGNIAHQITLIPGASSAMTGGVVSYSNDVKMKLLHVKKSDLERYGAVSNPVVEQMAKGVCDVTGADIGISTSGIAGPGGGSVDKPVGTVWMAAYYAPSDRIVSTVEVFSGNRSEIIDQATERALSLAISILSD